MDVMKTKLKLDAKRLSEVFELKLKLENMDCDDLTLLARSLNSRTRNALYPICYNTHAKARFVDVYEMYAKNCLKEDFLHAIEQAKGYEPGMQNIEITDTLLDTCVEKIISRNNNDYTLNNLDNFEYQNNIKDVIKEVVK